MDEDGLRRIVGVLTDRASSLGYKTAVVLVVHREDDRFYETLNISDVLSDPNAYEHRILDLSIELRVDDPLIPRRPWERDWIVQISYVSAKKGMVRINVDSEDKTWALLLADELEPQVRRTRSEQRISTLVLIVFFCAVASFCAALAKGFGSAVGLSTVSVERIVFVAWGIAVILSFNVLEDRPAWIRLFAGPESAFNWGERAKSFQRNIERQKSFFWVVIVGLLVSVVSSLYVSLAIPTAPVSGTSAPSTPASAP